MMLRAKLQKDAEYLLSDNWGDLLQGTAETIAKRYGVSVAVVVMAREMISKSGKNVSLITGKAVK